MLAACAIKAGEDLSVVNSAGDGAGQTRRDFTQGSDLVSAPRGAGTAAAFHRASSMMRVTTCSTSPAVATRAASVESMPNIRTGRIMPIQVLPPSV